MNWRSPEKVFSKLFFLENTCDCVLGPWPRAFLSLASRGSVLEKAVLGLGFFFASLALASSIVSSTPPLAITKIVQYKTLKITQINIRGGVLEDVLGLEDTFWSPWPWPRRSSPWPWPRSLKSSKIALSSARGQHYFWIVEISLENARNFAENLRKPFLFSFTWSIGVAKGRGTGGPPPPQLKFHQWQNVTKKPNFSSVSVSF